jgi:hypothetical protein
MGDSIYSFLTVTYNYLLGYLSDHHQTKTPGARLVFLLRTELFKDFNRGFNSSPNGTLDRLRLSKKLLQLQLFRYSGYKVHLKVAAIRQFQ